MSRRLLERDTELTCLAGLMEGARNGRGSVDLVHGEAGIGKTSLVDAFCRRQRGVRILRGACDALFTPRPWGRCVK